jgi:hydrogenase maturation protein HypF
MAQREARRVTVRGTVQGVGFRPFVYRVARELGLAGWVRNDAGGVVIHAEGEPGALDSLERAIGLRHPPAAVVAEIRVEAAEIGPHASFEIIASDAGGTPTTRISPDLAVCEDCLRELRDRSDRRGAYPYINCTNCGPRYSIIRTLPYDRARTTMAAWPLCPGCRADYEDPSDRRYHAQPVACPRCGPAYRLVVDGEVRSSGVEALPQAAAMLSEGAILAMKGVGGYHLACAATDAGALLRLRERKFRKEKPFAVMTASLASAQGLATLGPVELDLLTGAARPIVLAPARSILPLVAPDTDEIGLMLPYAPLHHLLFDAGAPDPLVLTSANRSSEPIAFEDGDALERLAGIADAFLVGERPIQRRVDDAVVGVRRGRPFMIRRGRGYAPASVATLRADRQILGIGADLKNAVALAVGGEVFVSQHIGDLGDLDTDRAFRETIDDLLGMYDVDRARLVVAHDMHPEYVSTGVASGLGAGRLVAVQHHEAHIAAVLLEHGRLAEQVVGLALDGTGYGRDGTIWGGEVFVGSALAGFRRVGSLPPVEMPGGDGAVRFPVQAAAAFLPGIDPAVLEAEPFGFPPRFRQAQAIRAAGVRSMRSTSAGRLFDAAAAVCGFVREVTFEGQAAMWLEHLARGGKVDRAGIGESQGAEGWVRAIVDARRRGADPADLAAWFHDALARWLVRAAAGAAAGAGCSTVVVSGGVWQNRRLLDLTAELLPVEYRLLWGEQTPSNDGGICAGQVAMASCRLRDTP